MKTVFDGTAMAFDQYIMLLFPLAALAVTVIAIARGARRRWHIIGGLVTVFVFLLTFALPLADHVHVQAAVREGRVRTVEGRISGFKHEVERRFTGTSQGVGVTSSHNYTTVTTEQFFIGDIWFWYELGGFPARNSFTNIGDPPLALKDGMTARATWFADGWYGDQRRIVKLELGDGARGAGPSAKSGDAAFDAFWTRFSAAAAKGDMAGVKALTRFPFLFAGTPLTPDRFESIWMGIFPAPLRPCFGTATPVKDGDAWSVSCGVYVYVFEKGTDGWRLATFTADPEAEGP